MLYKKDAYSSNSHNCVCQLQSYPTSVVEQ